MIGAGAIVVVVVSEDLDSVKYRLIAERLDAKLR